MLADDPWEWRAVWVSGLVALDAGDSGAAQPPSTRSTARCRASWRPSSPSHSPASAAARATSPRGSTARARSTDANYIAPAAFGLARIRAGRGDVDGAVAALDLVPSTSRSFTEARRLRAGHLDESGGGLPALSQAMGSINGVRLDPREQAQLTARSWSGRSPRSSSRARRRSDDRPYAGPGDSLRDGLENTYRELAGTGATTRAVRARRQANSVRRWTLR